MHEQLRVLCGLVWLHAMACVHISMLLGSACIVSITMARIEQACMHDMFRRLAELEGSAIHCNTISRLLNLSENHLW